MTDITDQDRRDAREWAEDVAETFKYDDEVPRETRAAVNYILATVDAPEPTLAEEVKKGLLFRVNDTDAEGIKDALDLAARVEQMETEWEEELDQISADRDHWCAENARLIDKLERVRDAARDLMHEGKTAEEWMQAYEEAAQDLSDARAEVERLTAERQEETMRRVNEQYDDLPVRDRDWLDKDDLPDPADVPAGEVWSAKIWYGDEQYPGTAIKTTGGDWNVYRAEGTHSTYRTDEYVELVARLVPETDLIDRAATNAAETITNAFGVPAPRQVTTRGELNALPEGTVVRAKGELVCERYRHHSKGLVWISTGVDEDFPVDRPVLPATVLWTPEETK